LSIPQPTPPKKKEREKKKRKKKGKINGEKIKIISPFFLSVCMYTKAVSFSLPFSLIHSFIWMLKVAVM